MEEIIKSLERYNFWGGNQQKTGFTRSFYLDKITKYINNSLIKVIVGQRRAGKSFILRQIAAYLIDNGVQPNNIFYLNKEFIAFDTVKNYQDLDAVIQYYKIKLKPEGKIYLLIDEIQNIHQWEKIVNSYSQDFTEEYEIFITGSNSNMLSGELSSMLSGRYVSFEIFPFSYQEYLLFHNLDRGKHSYIKYLEDGGLPELYVLPDKESKMHYVSSVKDTVLLRDIIQRYAIKEPKLLEDIFIYLANNASNLISINNITNYFKHLGRRTTYDTVANYIGYIEEAYLIHKAYRYDIKGKDTISGNVKFYINDMSYKNYLYKGFGYGLGYQLENLIYLELRRQGYDVYVGSFLNKEIDFVAQKADQKIYLQSAYIMDTEKTFDREYSALEIIDDHYEKLVVSLDDVLFPIMQGIKHVQAWKLDLHFS